MILPDPAIQSSQMYQTDQKCIYEQLSDLLFDD